MRTNRVNVEASDSGHARVGAHTTHVLKPMYEYTVDHFSGGRLTKSRDEHASRGLGPVGSHRCWEPSPFPASYVTLKRQRNQEIRSRGSAGG